MSEAKRLDLHYAPEFGLYDCANPIQSGGGWSERMIARMVKDHMTTEERDELGHMFATAPSTLEALKQLVSVLPDDEVELAREVWGNTNTALVKSKLSLARAALAKANGTPQGKVEKNG